MLLERALSWAVVLAGGLTPIFVVFVALVIERSRRHKLDYWTMANGSVGDQDQRHHCIEVPPQCHRSPGLPQTQHREARDRGRFARITG